MTNEWQLYVPGPDGSARPTGGPVSRRAALGSGLAGALGLATAGRLRADTTPSPSPTEPPAKAKAVIQIWMWGGPSHLDTFDPKPAAGSDYCGPLSSPISTNVSGIRIGELLPELAQLADKYSIIRSMTHGVFGHETASYITQTGRNPGGRLVYPCVGAVVSCLKGVQQKSDSLIPPYIVLTRPQGRFSEAGFLGIRHKPFATGGDPNATRFAVEGIIAPDITDQQQKERRNLLKQLNTLCDFAKADPALAKAEQSVNEAYDLILGDAGKVFDLNQEEETLRQRYGRNTFGQSCLVARRLVERGVRFVTINYGGWDTHKQHFQTMRRKLPELDRGMSTLISDLSEKGLLDSTIIWWSGEFGRTPKVDWEPPWNGGRGHYGRVFSAVVAGGGFKGGQVVGSSDAKGEHVKDRPVFPCDLIGTMYQLLGIDPEGKLPHPMGEAVQVTPSPEENIQMAGRVDELISTS